MLPVSNLLDLLELVENERKRTFSENVEQYYFLPPIYWCLKAYSRVSDNFWQLKALIKIMENYLHFTLKAIFVLKIFKFCHDFFDYVGKRHDAKVKVNFKI